ncbi:hypothetical protein EJB05_33837 [Eragrostis curvula]|uniref:AIG1-type G domain-containing protein n=1 Tax=Eragrostis curvula TaxID=38414 RepID=A0A5J9U3W1_9POAL|nr:hypothetical protein EJB05_33837 [Eragrostis curvula]
MATTTDADRVEPLAEQEEEPKKVEPPAAAAAAAAEEEEEEPKKVEAGAEDEEEREEVRLEGKDGDFGSLEAENGEAEADGGRADDGEVEAAEGEKKGESLGAVEAEKEDRELAAEVAEFAASVVAETSATGVESVNGELGEEDASPAPQDAPTGEKGELVEEEPKPEESVVVAEVNDEGKVADDTESAMPVEEKLEDTKGEEMDSGDGGGGELGGGEEEKEVGASAESMEVAEPEDKVAPAEANGELAGEVEASDDSVAVGGEEAPEESLEKKADVEGEAAKPEPANEEIPVVTNDASVEELVPASEDANPEPVSVEIPASEDTRPETLSEESPVMMMTGLVTRLGATPEETVAAQVLYRLSLAEGIRHGRPTNRAFSLDNARKKALLLEAEGKEDLNFSCNILVLGKTGVGKSATINSIFGEEKSKTDAFSSATTSVREIVGDVDGVKIRIIDTPGLRPNVMDQGSNRKILAAVKKYTKKCPPDIVLYVDRLDSLSRDLNDLPLLKTITAVLGSSIWFNAIVALTHAASAPPEGLNGAPMTYEVLMAQRSHIIQQSIRQAAGDMRLMNPVALVENHPSCRRNREGQKVLPNGQSWRHQMLLLCYSSKILSEANSLLKLQDPNPGKLFGQRFRSPPLPFLLSSLLQSRAHPKLSPDQGGNEGDSDIDLDDYSDMEQDDDEEEYDQLPPFKPLTKAQLARLTNEQKNAYFDEYDYRVKLLQKKQWKDEIRRLKEMKKRGKTDLDDYGYANIAGENDQDPPPENVSVPLPDMVLPPSFDCDNPTYRYRFLEPTSTVLARPVLDAHGWDHDCGYDGVSVEETLAILNRFPANVAVQVTKDKKEFSIHLDSSVSAKHGENASSLAGFDIQTVGRQLAYILRGETKIKNIKKNKTTGGFSVTFLGDIVATGLKVEDQLSLGKRLALVASTGAMRAQGDTAYGANLEARLKDKDYPIGQSLSTLGLSLMKWRRDLALGANLQAQFSIGRGSKMAVRLGLNNKLSGQITVRTSTSEQVQIALLGLVPVAASIYRSFRPSEPSFAY